MPDLEYFKNVGGIVNTITYTILTACGTAFVFGCYELFKNKVNLKALSQKLGLEERV